MDRGSSSFSCLDVLSVRARALVDGMDAMVLRKSFELDWFAWRTCLSWERWRSSEGSVSRCPIKSGCLDEILKQHEEEREWIELTSVERPVVGGVVGGVDCSIDW